MFAISFMCAYRGPDGRLSCTYPATHVVDDPPDALDTLDRVFCLEHALIVVNRQ